MSLILVFVALRTFPYACVVLVEFLYSERGRSFDNGTFPPQPLLNIWHPEANLLFSARQ